MPNTSIACGCSVGRNSKRREEVGKWRFRVGTEPDFNPGHWTGTRANLLDGEHAGFMGERNADMERVRARAGDEAKPFAIAARVMAAHQAKYERLSKLQSLDPLPNPIIDSSGRMHFDLTMDGHTVVLLQLK